MPSAKALKDERRAAAQELQQDSVRMHEVVDSFGAYVLTLTNSIELQEQRIVKGQFHEVQMDLQMVTGLLRDLIDAADGLKRLGLPVDSALERFLASSAGVKNARDVLVHRSEYLQGVGRLQLAQRIAARERGDDPPDVQFEQFFSRGAGSDATIHMSVGQDVSSPVGLAFPAAYELANSLMEVIHDWLDANPLPE